MSGAEFGVCFAALDLRERFFGGAYLPTCFGQLATELGSARDERLRAAARLRRVVFVDSRRAAREMKVVAVPIGCDVARS